MDWLGRNFPSLLPNRRRSRLCALIRPAPFALRPAQSSDPMHPRSAGPLIAPHEATPISAANACWETGGHARNLKRGRSTCVDTPRDLSLALGTALVIAMEVALHLIIPYQAKVVVSAIDLGLLKAL